MSTDPCDDFRGMIAMEVVGHISESERVALRAHTEGCVACRDERRGLLRLTPALGRADPDHFNEHGMPIALRAAVLDRLAADGRHARRHRSHIRLSMGAIAAAAAAIVLVLTLSRPSTPSETSLALIGQPDVHAQVRLTAEAWGTALELRESGQPQGETLTVDMRTSSGSWWQAGTYRTAGSSVRVTMACALKLSDISAVWVRNQAGAVVLRGAVDSYDGGAE